MRTKHPCVLTHIRIKGKVGNFLTDRSKVVLLLWVFFNLYLSFSYCLACVMQPCGHLWGKD